MKKSSIILDILIILSSFIGILLTFSINNFMTSRALLYYTIQSNICILIISVLFLIYKIFKKKIPNYLYIIKFICTVGITVTFLVFAFVLVPQMFGGFNAYLLSIGNLTVHFISPVLSIISFILFDKIENKKFTCLYGIIMPIYYCVFIFIINLFVNTPLFGSMDGSFSRFPYFFMDYETNGWFRFNGSMWNMGFFYWFVLLFIVVILISVAYLKLNRKRNE